ncbi:MAG: MFS transporter [Gulosibacter sp.]|uniref:MFS transporter n=1 Tax=Gulosibacter sp. TaxID=2817531 RepID=UPI003F920C26
MKHRSSWVFIALGLLAIALLSFNLRTAVSSFSPITLIVGEEIPLSSLSLGVIGMLPPLCFAAAGFIARPLSRRFSLESIVVVSLAVIVVGFVIRSLAQSAWGIGAGTAIALVAMGVGNVLLPPIVKARFPKHIGPITSVYIVGIAISASAPPLIAAQLANDHGWRFSLAFWGAVAICAMLPWIVLWITDRNTLAVAPAITGAVPTATTETPRPFHSRTAWVIAALFCVCSLNSYAIFAWLPQLLIEFKGLDPAAANLQLSWFALLGIPVGFIAPTIATRDRHVRSASFIGVGLFISGYALMLVVPGSQVFWPVTLLGVAQLLFSMSMTLVSVRSATVLGAARLSAFVQGVGYLIAATGPLIVSLLHSTTGSWVAPVIFLMLTGVATLPAAYLVDSKNDYEREVTSRPS